MQLFAIHVLKFYFDFTIVVVSTKLVNRGAFMREKTIGREMSGCETLIMKIVWSSEEDLSTPEIMDQLKLRYGKDYARTTVVTFIQRLAEKGFVNTYKKGRVSYVHSLRSQAKYQENFIQEAEEFWFDGDAGYLFSTLCKVKKLSKKEVDDIQKMLDELDDQILYCNYVDVCNRNDSVCGMVLDWSAS